MTIVAGLQIKTPVDKSTINNGGLPVLIGVLYLRSTLATGSSPPEQRRAARSIMRPKLPCRACVVGCQQDK